MTTTSPTQLVLGVQPRDEANFDNFFISAANRAVLSELKAQSSAQHNYYLWGPTSSGRTHLLQALCHHGSEEGAATLYLPLNVSATLSPDLLQGANSLSMVCIDDLDAICGEKQWEQALFVLFNELLGSDTRLVIAANCAPQQLPIELPDLKSRVQASAVFQLTSPDDDEKRDILRLRAANRGMELNTQVADYLIQRSERSLKGLLAVLDQLDQATLERGRRLTIPLIKEVLGW